MTSIQFLQSVLDWLLADPAHIVTAASAIAALTPNPDPNTVAGKIYRIVDILALNILRAKAAAIAPTVLANMPSSDTAKAKQAGFVRGIAPQLILVTLGVAMLCGCSAAQNAFSQANTQVVQATLGAGRDQLAIGREFICGAPYQVVADAMADDANMGTAVPALCPATRAVAITTPPTKATP